jgi:hypothetical protein
MSDSKCREGRPASARTLFDELVIDVGTIRQERIGVGAVGLHRASEAIPYQGPSLRQLV